MCHHTRKHRDLEHEARRILETRLMEEEARRKRAEEERRIRYIEEHPLTEKVKEMAVGVR